MAQRKMGRTKDMHVWIKPEDHQAAIRVADELGQTMPTFVERAIVEAVRRFDEQNKNLPRKPKAA